MDICPYCLSPILEDEEAATCDICGTPHHAECLRENDGCAVKNCKKLARSKRLNIEVEPKPRTMLVLSKESVEQAAHVNMHPTSNPCIKCGKQLPEGELYCLECTPSLEDNQDARNIGPMLVMVGVIALVVGWLAVMMIGTQPSDDTPVDLATGSQHNHIRH